MICEDRNVYLNAGSLSVNVSNFASHEASEGQCGVIYPFLHCNLLVNSSTLTQDISVVLPCASSDCRSL
jgi:hypothetical protein